MWSPGVRVCSRAWEAAMPELNTRQCLEDSRLARVCSSWHLLGWPYLPYTGSPWTSSPVRLLLKLGIYWNWKLTCWQLKCGRNCNWRSKMPLMTSSPALLWRLGVQCKGWKGGMFTCHLHLWLVSSSSQLIYNLIKQIKKLILVFICQVLIFK